MADLEVTEITSFHEIEVKGITHRLAHMLLNNGRSIIVSNHIPKFALEAENLASTIVMKPKLG
jgi:hypothetical protein